MLEMFLESLLLGALLATAFAALRMVVRRAAARRLGGLPAGEPLRCVQPHDVIGR
jgi:hypothetical protein